MKFVHILVVLSFVVLCNSYPSSHWSEWGGSNSWSDWTSVNSWSDWSGANSWSDWGGANSWSDWSGANSRSDWRGANTQSDISSINAWSNWNGAAGSVIIVGAGVSGLSAARYLLDNTDYKVTILEASPDRYGGRIYSSAFNNFPDNPLEMGAMYLHEVENVMASQQPVAKYCKEKGFLLIPAPSTLSVYVNASDVVDRPTEHIWNDIDKLVEAGYESTEKFFDSDLADKPFFEGLKENSKWYSEAFTKWPKWQQELGYSFIEELNGCKAEELSSKMFAAGDPYREGQIEFGNEDGNMYLPKGYNQFLDSLINDGRRRIEILLGQRVGQIEIKESGKVEIIAETNEYSADRVIVTVPLGVMKQDDIKFIPSLGVDQTLAIERIGFGIYEKTILLFDKVFWPTDKAYFFHLPGNTSRMQMYGHAMNQWNGLNALVFAISGKYAEQVSEMSDDVAKQTTLDVVDSMFPGKRVESGAHLMEFERTDWKNNPFVRGAYSFPKIGMRVEDTFNIGKSHLSKVFFAGEHTMMPENQYASVHGAFLSGTKAAMSVDSSFGKTDFGD